LPATFLISKMAPPTEQTILSTCLVPPAPLPAIISLKAFTALFPRGQQSSPQIRTLYRDLQHQRANLTDSITKNIAEEVKRGNAQRRAVAKARGSSGRGAQDDEVDIEQALFGATSNLTVSNPHTLTSILAEMESAVEDIEGEIDRLDEEANELLEGIKATVGALSDLRYGRFANGQLGEQVLKGLSRLETACENK